MRTLEDIEEGLNKSLGEKVGEFWRNLWRDHWVTKQEELEAILKEDQSVDELMEK